VSEPPGLGPLEICFERRADSPSCCFFEKVVRKSRAKRPGFGAPKAGALPGCATPRLSRVGGFLLPGWNHRGMEGIGARLPERQHSACAGSAKRSVIQVQGLTPALAYLGACFGGLSPLACERNLPAGYEGRGSAALGLTPSNARALACVPRNPLNARPPSRGFCRWGCELVRAQDAMARCAVKGTTGCRVEGFPFGSRSGPAVVPYRC